MQLRKYLIYVYLDSELRSSTVIIIIYMIYAVQDLAPVSLKPIGARTSSLLFFHPSGFVLVKACGCDKP